VVWGSWWLVCTLVRTRSSKEQINLQCCRRGTDKKPARLQQTAKVVPKMLS
jgi:hypothetical protein